MVSYDEAVAIVQDPQADPVMLAKVAYENPEFGANVAAHPHAYPGLKRWIAQFGDERARRMVRSRAMSRRSAPSRTVRKPRSRNRLWRPRSPRWRRHRHRSSRKGIRAWRCSMSSSTACPTNRCCRRSSPPPMCRPWRTTPRKAPRRPIAAAAGRTVVRPGAAAGGHRRADPAGRRERIRVHGAASGHHQRPGRHAADRAVCTRTACGARRQPLPLPRTAGMAWHVGQPGRQRGPLAPPVTPYNA